jgi:hypothetical protein
MIRPFVILSKNEYVPKTIDAFFDFSPINSLIMLFEVERVIVCEIPIRTTVKYIKLTSSGV